MDNRDKTSDSTDGRVELAKDMALGKHDSNPSHLDEAGEGVGGIGGVVTGAAIGSAIGPIGTIIGGIAGAVGGWWAGRAVTEAASTLTTNDDEYYRAHYDKSDTRAAERSYDDVRPSYQVGHVAAQNPDYASKDWKDVEPDIKRGWTSDNANKHGDWDSVRGYASEGYTRGRSALGTAAAATERTMDKAASGAENMGHKAAAGAERMGNKIANAADDMKDRMDGDPASMPGKDSTDSARRKNN